MEDKWPLIWKIVILLEQTSINSITEWCNCKLIYQLTSNNNRTQWPNMEAAVKCINLHTLKDNTAINHNQTTINNSLKLLEAVSHMDIPAISIQTHLHLWWLTQVEALIIIWMAWWTIITPWLLINSNKFIWVKPCRTSHRATIFRNQIKVADTRTEGRITLYKFMNIVINCDTRPINL